MKKVKALHFWIDSYTEIEKSVEELRLAFDFVKEGIVSEEEVDEIYKRTTELIENLELRNMLRREEDKLGVVLKINSGARIKSESASVKQWILSLEKVDKACYDYKRENGERLIVSYSDKRAKKDAYNRDRGIVRLRKAYKTGRITKSQVNKRGYNKFLEISKDIEVVISEEKIAEDCQWDGLKGYITNTDLDAERVIAEYHGLWVVERAFRISKGTLEMRPMFHFTERRIEAHVCICFIAYKVYKELERLIAINKIGMSVDKVLEAAKTITTIRVRMPKNGTYFTKTLFLTEKHLAVKPLFDISGNKS